jgi:DNA polymerase III epsilon subunit-like protein
MSAATYLFYDLETTGLNPAFDQILQFAAIETDEQWQKVNRHEIRVRLRPDIIPAPGALLATRLDVMQTMTGVCEYEAVREIHRLVNRPNRVNLGYNSLHFDDQFLRFAFWRNLLPAYDHQWRDGCRRLDVFPITVLYWLAQSPLLKWPVVDGKPTLKLEHLKAANGLAEGQAHDALVDVAATVELTRRLQQDGALWQSIWLTLISRRSRTAWNSCPNCLTVTRRSWFTAVSVTPTIASCRPSTWGSRRPIPNARSGCAWTGRRCGKRRWRVWPRQPALSPRKWVNPPLSCRRPRAGWTTNGGR